MAAITDPYSIRSDFHHGVGMAESPHSKVVIRCEGRQIQVSECPRLVQANVDKRVKVVSCTGRTSVCSHGNLVICHALMRARV